MNPELSRELKLIKKRLDDLEQGRREVVAWTAWNPTITQSGSVSVTVGYARYMKIQNMVITQVLVECTGAGTAGNAIVIGNAPAAIQPTNLSGTFSVIGTGIIENGGTRYEGSLFANAAQDWRILASGNTGSIGATPSFALASGDEISFVAMYEV